MALHDDCKNVQLNSELQRSLLERVSRTMMVDGMKDFQPDGRMKNEEAGERY